MNPDITFGVILRRLLHSVHLADFRQYFGEQACFIEKLEGAARVALGKHLGQFVADPFTAYGVNARRQLPDGCEGRRLKGEPEPCRKTHCAQQAKLVVFKSAARLTDSPGEARVLVGWQ